MATGIWAIPIPDFNPRSPCGERPFSGRHAVRRAKHFNPRSPCGERQDAIGCIVREELFQSTLPMRGATHYGSSHSANNCYFNPRSPCGERPAAQSPEGPNLPGFQSTLPMRGATAPCGSISGGCQDFNPRSPCGERQQKCAKKSFLQKHYTAFCFTEAKTRWKSTFLPLIGGQKHLFRRANHLGQFCSLPLRTTALAAPLPHNCFSRHSAQSWCDNDFPADRNAGCPYPVQ